jgi:hypothetical protein
MPSPFLPLERFSELTKVQQDTLELISGFFFDVRLRPISHMLNLSYVDVHMSTLLISSEPKMRNNLFHVRRLASGPEVVRLMDQMLGLIGGNEHLQKVLRAAYTANGWDAPLKGEYRVLEVDGAVGFEIGDIAMFVLRTEKPVSLDALASVDFTHPDIFTYLNPLSARDSLSELH